MAFRCIGIAAVSKELLGLFILKPRQSSGFLILNNMKLHEKSSYNIFNFFIAK